MDVQLGHSDRYGGPMHLIVDVGGRKVLACAGGASKNLSAVPFEQAGEGLDCDLCRRLLPTFLGAVLGSLAWHKSGRISPAMFCVASCCLTRSRTMTSPCSGSSGVAQSALIRTSAAFLR